MADTKITGATDIVTLAATDVIPVGRPGNTTAYKATMAEVKTYTAPGFNVRQYGAVGDGVTDDTAAIQAAVDALRTAEGGRLYFPAGRYLVTSTITMSISRPSSVGDQYSVEICGDGGASQIYYPTLDGTDCFYIIAVQGEMAALHIHDLSFQGGGFYPSATGSCLHLRRCIMPAMIDNVFISRFGGGAGIKLQSTWCTTVQNTRVFYCQYGIHTLNDPVSGSYGSSVNHSHLCSDYSGNDIGFYGVGGPAHLNIDNCIIEGNVSHGVQLTGVYHAYLHNIYLETNGIPDIELVTCPYATISNITGNTVSLDVNCGLAIIEQNEITHLINNGYYARVYGNTLETGNNNYQHFVTTGNWDNFTANDTTPSVLINYVGRVTWLTQNTVPTTITMFDDGYPGQEIWVKVHDTNTTFDFTGTYLVGNSGVDYTATNNDMIHAIKWGNYWYCEIIKAA